jgi:8-oxo-dGTP pyrophosphatase MutT (NUDIX family)
MPKITQRINGTGLLLPVKRGRKTKFVFPVVKEIYWKTAKGTPVIEYAGVGGKPEGTETRLQAVFREAREEIGCEVKLKHAHETLFFDTRTGKIRKRKLRGTPAPLLKFQKIIQTPAGPRLLDSVVWVGIPVDEPRPSAEVPALLLLTENLLNQTLKKEVTLAQLLSHGAELIEVRPVPRHAVVKPFGTPEVVGTVFGHKLMKNLKG